MQKQLTTPLSCHVGYFLVNAVTCKTFIVCKLTQRFT